jgi:hypothetical protein
MGMKKMTKSECRMTTLIPALRRRVNQITLLHPNAPLRAPDSRKKSPYRHSSFGFRHSKLAMRGGPS